MGEGADATLYSYVSNDPIGAIDPLGLWQVTIGGGLGLGGSVTFGNNGGSVAFNGNWNVGAQVGEFVGAAATLDISNTDPNAPNGVNNASGSTAFTAQSTETAGIGIASFKESASVGVKMGGCPDKVDLGAKASLIGSLGLPGTPRIGGMVNIKVGVSGPTTGSVSDANSYGNISASNGASYSFGALANPISAGFGHTF